MLLFGNDDNLLVEEIALVLVFQESVEDYSIMIEVKRK